MKTQISLGIFYHSHKDQVVARVRKVRFEDHIVIDKYGLTKTGVWILVPEGERYPPECFLPLSSNVLAITLAAGLTTEEFRNGIEVSTPKTYQLKKEATQ